jgi:hypothetical protein
MNKSQRVYFNSGSTKTTIYGKMTLEQDVDTLEFMSMKLSSDDIYQNFNSDYGVLVGKVIANGGIGIPNVKISIFISLTDEDADMGQITSIYPYKTPRDKNNEGKRYNLLPRVAKVDPNTAQWSPKQPFGSFPIKEEVVTNSVILDVYRKYYKYTALTNSAGDYMIFGVPTGVQTVHMSVDITDIGEYSMNPAAMVTNLGYSPNLFTKDTTRIKPSSDLNDLPNIDTQEITVDIIPFWGDISNYEIGITRQDFKIKAVLMNTFTVFGSAFTDGANNMWGGDKQDTTKKVKSLYHSYSSLDVHDEWSTLSIATKRIGKISEKIYYYPPNISDEDIDSGNVDENGKDMLSLDPTEYTIHKRDGDFVFIINCNRNKIITNELGVKVPIDYNSPYGVFTEFRGFITLEITQDEIPMNFDGTIGVDTLLRNNVQLKPYRYKLKFPQYAKSGQGFTVESKDTLNAVANTAEWRKQNYRFSGGKFYSISRHHGLTENIDNDDDNQVIYGTQGFLQPDNVNMIDHTSISFTYDVGIIATSSESVYDNELYDFPTNSTYQGHQFFGSNWLNFSVYLPQVAEAYNGYAYIKYILTSDNFSIQNSNTTENELNSYYLIDNFQKIAAGDYNTKWFARSDLHWTDFIEVPLHDIAILGKTDGKKYVFDPEAPNALQGKYRNGTYTPNNWYSACPLNDGKPLSNGGRINANPNNPPDPNTYIYKGFGNANCIQYLVELGLIN